MNFKSIGITLGFILLFSGCKALKQDIIYGDPISYEITTPTTIKYDEIVAGNYKYNNINYLEDEKKKYVKKETHNKVVGAKIRDIYLPKVEKVNPLFNRSTQIKKETKRFVEPVGPVVGRTYEKDIVNTDIVTNLKDSEMIKKSIFSLIKSFKTLEKKEAHLSKDISSLKNISMTSSNENDPFTRKLMNIIDGMHDRMNKLEGKIENASKRDNTQISQAVRNLQEEVKTLSFRKNGVSSVDLSPINMKIEKLSNSINFLKRGLSGVISKLDYQKRDIPTKEIYTPRNKLQYQGRDTDANSIENIKQRFVSDIDQPLKKETNVSRNMSNIDDVLATFTSLKNGVYKALKNIKVYAFSNDKNYLIDEIKSGETFKLEECYECENMLFRKIDGIEGYIKNR